MLLVETLSGAKYRITHDAICRVSDSHTMRRDDGWIELYETPRAVIGEPMVLRLEPLSPDAFETVRTTTPVVSIECE